MQKVSCCWFVLYEKPKLLLNLRVKKAMLGNREIDFLVMNYGIKEEGKGRVGEIGRMIRMCIYIYTYIPDFSKQM